MGIFNSKVAPIKQEKNNTYVRHYTVEFDENMPTSGFFTDTRDIHEHMQTDLSIHSFTNDSQDSNRLYR
jgi:hypothetical protein